MSDWLDNFHDANHSVQNCIYQLEDLGVALNRVGNQTLACEIMEVAHRLTLANKQARDSVTESISERVQRGEENLKQTVGLVFSHILRVPHEDIDHVHP